MEGRSMRREEEMREETAKKMWEEEEG